MISKSARLIKALNGCKNFLFYFFRGITAGICMIWMILIYGFSKLLPNKPFLFGILIGGWIASALLVEILWKNLRTVYEQYGTHVGACIIFVCVLSFGYYYYFGPVTNPRCGNSIEWSLEDTASLFISFRRCFEELSVNKCLILLATYLLPASWISTFRSFWKLILPPHVKLLSEDQYREQGVQETQKALKDLRGYCSSPEFYPWRAVLKIKNPVRFAEFICGNSHLTDAEISAYETELRHGDPMNESEVRETVLENELH